MIEDDVLSKMYKSEMANIDKFLTEYSDASQSAQTSGVSRTSPVSLRECVAGVDWVADEFGFPFCAFAHSNVLKQIQECRKVNPNFGVRIHAGEGLIRFSTVVHDDRDTPVGRLFRFHLFVLMASIRKIHEILAKQDLGNNSEWNGNCNIRIGHGIAFLFEEQRGTLLNNELIKFREFLREQEIVCELSPTSNHMLIPGTFNNCSAVTNDRSLESFLKKKLPVVLCTDDDGIWAIKKCASHHHHISVAHEFCEAIERKEIKFKDQLEKLISDGRKFAFALASETPSP